MLWLFGYIYCELKSLNMWGCKHSTAKVTLSLGSPEGAGWEDRDRVEKASWEKRKKINNWRIENTKKGKNKEKTMQHLCIRHCTE